MCVTCGYIPRIAWEPVARALDPGAYEGMPWNQNVVRQMRAEYVARWAIAILARFNEVPAPDVARFAYELVREIEK